MADYTKTTNFTAKDTLSSGDPDKAIKGSEHDTEFDNIATAISTKADKIAPSVGTNVAILSSGGDVADGGYRFTALSGEITVTTSEMNNLAPIPSGTKMIFRQSSAPTGWTQDVTANDKMLRVISSGSISSGGSWTISGFTADGHALTVDELPEHRHFIAAAVDDANSSASLNSTQQVYRDGGPDSSNREYRLSPTSTEATVGRTSPTGSNSAHTHTVSNDASWRPSYVDVIVATRD